jgi:hypothetical protein
MVSILKRVRAVRKKLLTLQAGAPTPTKNAVDRQRGDVLGHPACQKINTPLPFQEIPGCDAQGDPCPPKPAELVHNVQALTNDVGAFDVPGCGPLFTEFGQLFDDRESLNAATFCAIIASA